jgi:hypothetical protein
MSGCFNREQHHGQQTLAHVLAGRALSREKTSLLAGAHQAMGGRHVWSEKFIENRL